MFINNGLILTHFQRNFPPKTSFPVTGSSTSTRTLNFFEVAYIRQCNEETQRANRYCIKVGSEMP